ncbi:hypothetical protein CTP10_R80320 (plasmid) [Cupriavidus sp. P-10]|uniref:hypothetical protein n=1 Tax=unclassified Cupriavidus TaxID=2640874 RepID=UPI000E2FA997|nr:hypothetical protein [Cupriavidus sp. P-10]BDB30615.1 hypothetical protein CTP10_R80320 [Cupriavidus sp. P-10]
MKLRPTERQYLLEQHAKAVDRMVRCLNDAELQKADEEVVSAWAEYSDDNCATWLALPDDDATLRTILLRYLVRQEQEAASERVTAIAAADGSGDLMISLSAELVESLDWREGDQLSIEIADGDTLVLQRL